MATVVIVGMQWGDEGKGKVVDLLCPAFDAVARFQGGHNAGHTVKFADRHFALTLIPSGILHPGIACVLGNGMVIDPEALFAELDRLTAAGVDTTGRLFVSDRAHVILPPHVALDRAREGGGGIRIGTTGRGIGPAYELKAGRAGLRTCDLMAPDLEARLRDLGARVEAELLALGGEPIGHPARLADLCLALRPRLKPMLRDTGKLLNGWIDEGRSVLFEGAQGALLDLDHGTYPYVTSSSATAGGASAGTGVPPTRIDGVVGVLKAYSTRVGGGPFPTELAEATGEHLRKRGNEFGTVTGRPRRCGWFDLVAARYSKRLNGVDAIALTKLDVLDDLAEIRVCTGYRVRGEVVADYPADLRTLEEAEPVYLTVRGWRQETVGVLEYGDLPQAARDYVQLVEDELEAPVALISTGPRREETIVRPGAALDRLAGGRIAAVLAQRRPQA